MPITKLKKNLAMHCADCRDTLIEIESSSAALMEFIDDHRECGDVRLAKELPGDGRELIPVVNLRIGGPDNLLNFPITGPDNFVWRLPPVYRDCGDCGTTIEVIRYQGKIQDYVAPPFGVMIDFPVKCGDGAGEIHNKCRKCLQALLKRTEEG